MRYPPIGPKVTTNVPTEVHVWVKRESKRRGVLPAALLRELILVGYQSQTVKV